MKRDWIIEQILILMNKEGSAYTELEAERIVIWLEEEGLLNVHFGNEEVSEVIEHFKEVFGTTRTSKWDRFAASRLVKKHGVPAILKVIDGLSATAGDKYGPSVNNVSQIEEKWPAIIRFLGGQTPQEVREL